MDQTYLGDLLELDVGVAALLGCLQRNLIVVHKGFVNPQLAGLGSGAERKKALGLTFFFFLN